MSAIIFAANNTFNTINAAAFNNHNNNCSNSNLIYNHFNTQNSTTTTTTTTTNTTTTTYSYLNNIISQINISDIIICSIAAKADADDKPDKPIPDCCCQPQQSQCNLKLKKIISF